jgi:hypothetical protein
VKSCYLSALVSLAVRHLFLLFIRRCPLHHPQFGKGVHGAREVDSVDRKEGFGVLGLEYICEGAVSCSKYHVENRD